MNKKIKPSFLIVTLIVVFSILVSIWLPLFQIAAENLNFSTAYLSKQINGGTNKTNSNITDYFIVNDTSLTRNTTSANTGHFNNVAIFYSEKKYGNFILEFDITFSNQNKDTQTAWITFGELEKSGNYAQQKLTGMSLISIVRPTISSSNYVNMYLNTWTNAQRDGYPGGPSGVDGTATQHIKLVVAGDGKALLYWNNGDNYYTTKMDSSYTEGYIGLGTGYADVTISNVNIQELDENAVYFSNQLNGSANKTKDKISTYYTADGGVFNRNNNLATNNAFNNVPVIYTKEKYKDFTMEFDVTFSSVNKNVQTAWITFGEKEKNGNYIQQRLTGMGLIGIFRPSIANSKTVNMYLNTWTNIQKDGYPGGPSGVDGTAKHHVKVIVSDDVALLYFNNDTNYYTTKLDSSYEGGYVGIGTGSSDVTFSNINVYENDKRICYFSTSITEDVKKTDVSISEYYDIKETTYQRKNVDNGVDGRNVCLFYDNEYYGDFEAKFDLCLDSQQEIWFDIGAIDLLDSLQDSRSKGGMLLKISCFIENGEKYYEAKVYGLSEELEAAKVKITENINNINIKVKSKQLIITCNDEKLILGKVNTLYNGGYVGIGTGCSGVFFKDLNILKDNTILDAFIPYYTQSLTKSEFLSKEEFSEHWDIDGYKIVRKAKDTVDNHTYNMATLYLGEKEYTNFELTLKYTSQRERGCYVGVGASIGKSWYTNVKNPADRAWQPDEGNRVVFLRSDGRIQTGPIKSYIDGSSPDNWWYDSWLSDSGVLFDSPEEITAVHLLKLRVENEQMTVWIDDKSQGTVKLDNYNGGYIYLASNSYGVTFSDINILDYDNEQKYDFTGYSSYFVEDIENTGAEKCDPNNYWRISNEGVIERKNLTISGAKDQKDIAYLFVNDKKYVNFELNIDYKHGSTSWKRSFIGFDAELGETWQQSGIAATVWWEGVMEYIGMLDGKKFNSKIFWDVVDEDGNNLEYVKPYAVSDWHHLRLTVKDGYATVNIDNFDWDFDIQLPENYDGGYIFIASNSYSAMFKNLTINELAYEPEEVFLGWQPTSNDVDFDFSVKKKSENIHDYIPISMNLSKSPNTSDNSLFISVKVFVSCVILLTLIIIPHKNVKNIKRRYINV